MPGATGAILAAGVLAALVMSLAALVLSARTARTARARPVRPPPPRDSPGSTPAARALQHVGVVRFNPYHDTGGDYSFAVALIDGGGRGVVLSGLYHRDRCRVYAKPVQSWDSAYTLTDEEREALEQARGGGASPGLL